MSIQSFESRLKDYSLHTEIMGSIHLIRILQKVGGRLDAERFLFVEVSTVYLKHYHTIETV